MKLKPKIEKILEKYNLSVNIPDKYSNVYIYKDEFPDEVKKDFEHPTIDDGSLFEKYKNNIPIGWYGFSIGNPTPKKWFEAIDELLTFLIKQDPNFKIHQIKIKYGGIRFYCESDIIEDLFDIENIIEDSMFSNKLIY